jgi:NDP-sugar pyrophosphorylase family protein
VLAGERTWRHDSLESLGPRALLPVADRPLVAHAIEWLTDSSLATTVCTNGGAQQLRQALRARPNAGDVAFYDDDSPRGPSGCVTDVIAGGSSELVVVVESTVIPTFDLRRLLRAHAGSGAMATLVVQPQTGSPAEDGPGDIPAGVYVFNRTAFDYVPKTGYQDIKEGLLRRLYEVGEPVRIYEAREWCPRVIDSRSYLAAAQWAIRRLTRQRGTAVLADATARISDGAVLIGPVIIGANAVIMAGASVIGPAAIGSESLVQPHAVVSRSMVWERCTVGSGALVDQTVLVDGVTVNDGVRVIETLRVPPLPTFKAPPRRTPWYGRVSQDVVTVASVD